MKFLRRTLSVITFLLIAGQTVLLCIFIATAPWNEISAQPTPRKTMENNVSESTAESPLSFLWKLAVLPSLSREKEVIGVMIENHTLARPHHRGLEDALVIQEWFVEGYISRFIALFDLNDLPDSIGPVRSVRKYFLDGSTPWTNTFIHAGGSPDALELLALNRDLQSINGLKGAYHDAFTRDDSIAEPHNFFITQKSIADTLSDASVSTTSWPPYKYGRMQSREPAKVITIQFYNPLHNVRYVHDTYRNYYKRINGGVTSPAQPYNVLVLEIPVQYEGEQGRLHMNVSGEGKALLFRSGKVEAAQWKKESTADAFQFTGSGGSPLKFAKGQTWINVVDTLRRIEWDEQS